MDHRSTHALWLVALSVAGVLLARPACAQETDSIVDTAPVMKLQGTWRDDGGKSGTWRTELRGGQVLQKQEEFGTWESFAGMVRLDGAAGFEEQSATAWAVPGQIAFRVLGGEWKDAVFSGEVSGTQLRGRFASTDGRNGDWEGWWIAVRHRGAKDVDEQVDASK